MLLQAVDVISKEILELSITLCKTPKLILMEFIQTNVNTGHLRRISSTGFICLYGKFVPSRDAFIVHANHTTRVIPRLCYVIRKYIQ